jgi:predicted amidohydrolase
MKVCAVQHDIEWESPEENFAALRSMVHEAAEAGARLIALTEMYSNGFSTNTESIAEPVDGPSTRFLVDSARQTGAWVCGSVPELGSGLTRPHNCLVLAGPDGNVHRYAKKHRFAYAGEDLHYTAGADTVTVDLEGVRVSLFVCFDLRFAPDFWTVARETDLYLLVANWPASRSEHWTTLLRARAIENQAYVLGVNRIGVGDGIDYSGDSRVFDPLGNQLAAGRPNEQELIFADVDPTVVADVRSRFPFLDERTD